MHELSIALSLVELASAAAADADAGPVTAVYLRVGAMAGVVCEALEFSFEIAAADTPLAGARLVIEALPLIIHCAVCDHDVQPIGPASFRCPQCNTPSANVVQGRELDLVALEFVEKGVADEQPAPA
jgi:hydrogenase nickel incorporation protein HypA/HybF